MKPIITIVCGIGTEIDVRLEYSSFAPKDTVFIVPPQHSFLKMARTVSQAESALAEWIRRYENVFNGLKYWRNKALEK